ncbi:MAG TPA: hypothetical protein VFZ61_25565 [Polyangiales bacterium]
MPGRSSPGSRWSVAAAFAVALGACHDDTVIEVDENGDIVRRCFVHKLYLVEGDIFTFLGGGVQTIDSAKSGLSLTHPGANAEVEARATHRQELKGSRGWAELLWNDAVVDRFTVDRAFLSSGTVQILDHKHPDGTLVELHLYTTRDCSKDWLVRDVVTRELVEELEGNP